MLLDRLRLKLLRALIPRDEALKLELAKQLLPKGNSIFLGWDDIDLGGRNLYNRANETEEADFIVFKRDTSYYGIRTRDGSVRYHDTDARNVIQGVIDELSDGGKLALKGGTYELSDSINIASLSNLTIEGIGDAVILKANGNFPAFKLNDAVRCCIRRLHIYGSDDPANTTNHGIYITGTIHNCYENRIIDVFIEKCYDGIRIDCADIIWLARVYCWNNKNAGLNLLGDANWKVNWINAVDCYLGSNLSYGLLASYAMGCKFVNLTVEGENTTDYGVFMDYSYLNWFVNLDVENCVYSGIVSQRSISASAIGNRFLGGWSSGNGANGVYMYDERWASIEGMTIGENQEHGILLESCERIIVKGNVVYNNSKKSAGTYHGILISNSTNSIVAENHCHDTQSTKTQGYGVYEYGSTDYSIISLNNLRGNATGAVYVAGANTLEVNNLK